MDLPEPIAELFNKWGEMIVNTDPSPTPIVVASLLGVFIFLLLCFWNIRGLIRYTRIPDDGRQASVLAWVAWLSSIISPWTGPLLLIGTPMALVMGLWAWVRLPSPEARTVSIPQDATKPRTGREISRVRSLIPARMAVLNSVGVVVQIGLMIGAIYLAVGSVIRDILIDMWQHRDLFQDYIVT